MNEALNVVYIGGLSFPLGFASTKRRRYMVDYMNNHNIECHYLATRYRKSDVFLNQSEGMYGNCSYVDLSDYFNNRHYLSYFKYGKKYLKEWYNRDKRNILLFHTGLQLEDLIFYKYAKTLGYHIYFDQVETTSKYIHRNLPFKKKTYHYFSDKISEYAYKNCEGSFVISRALWRQNEARYPKMRLCLLQNSTPILHAGEKNCVSDTLEILYSGTFASKDGVDYLIKSVKEAVCRGVKCHLTMTGKGLPQDMEVLKTINGNPHFIYEGLVTDSRLEYLMLNSDVLTMTRTNSTFANYGFPFKLSEYLSTGNIVIATKVSDVCDYLTDKENALLVEPENATSIADAIEYVYKNKDKAYKIGQSGLEVAKNLFGIEKVGEVFIDFLCNAE